MGNVLQEYNLEVIWFNLWIMKFLKYGFMFLQVGIVKQFIKNDFEYDVMLDKVSKVFLNY